MVRHVDILASESITTDVLVLGGGIAGCFAAIRAKEDGANVFLVDKGCLGRSGLSFMMSGVLSYFDPDEDDYDQWYREAVETGKWLSDQIVLQGVINETTERIREMDSWGVQFQKEGSEFVRRAGEGQLHTRNVLMSNSGYQMMSVMRGEVLRRGVHVIEWVMTTDILTSDSEYPTRGRVVGAIGFNVRTGKFYIFKAKAVIIATGGTKSISTSVNTPILSGDGKAMAFRVGTEMRNADLCHYSPFPVGHNTAPGENILVGEGAVFVNAKGERFIKSWDAVRMERAPRVVVCRAMATEELEGRGPVYWDATHLDESAHNRIEKCIPIVVKSLSLAGLSFRKDSIPYSFGRSDLGPGGVRVDRENTTTIPGLYAAGAACDMGHVGVTGTMSYGIQSAIGGHRAGKAAAAFAAETGEPDMDEEQVKVLMDKVLVLIKRNSGLNHQEVRRHCMDIEVMGLLGPVKNQTKLKQAIDEVERMKENEIPKLVAKDYHELARTVSLPGELLFLEPVPQVVPLASPGR